MCLVHYALISRQSRKYSLQKWNKFAGSGRKVFQYIYDDIIWYIHVLKIKVSSWWIIVRVLMMDFQNVVFKGDRRLLKYGISTGEYENIWNYIKTFQEKRSLKLVTWLYNTTPLWIRTFIDFRVNCSTLTMNIIIVSNFNI